VIARPKVISAQIEFIIQRKKDKVRKFNLGAAAAHLAIVRRGPKEMNPWVKIGSNERLRPKVNIENTINNPRHFGFLTSAAIPGI
jgi:hypothetical protein